MCVAWGTGIVPAEGNHFSRACERTDASVPVCPCGSAPAELRGLVSCSVAWNLSLRPSLSLSLLIFE